MILRDWALASSGLIDLRIGGRPVYPYQPDAIWEALAITKERDFTYPASSGKDLYRRSLYTFWRRTVGPANMFDASNRQTCRVRSDHDEHAAARAHHAQRPDLGRGRAGPGRTKHESVERPR